MRTFVLIIFWILVFQIVLKIFLIQVAQYPRKTTLASDIGGIIENMALAIWAALVLWMLK